MTEFTRAQLEESLAHELELEQAPSIDVASDAHQKAERIARALAQLENEASNG